MSPGHMYGYLLLALIAGWGTGLLVGMLFARWLLHRRYHRRKKWRPGVY